jgi:hypothetical protein
VDNAKSFEMGSFSYELENKEVCRYSLPMLDLLTALRYLLSLFTLLAKRKNYCLTTTVVVESSSQGEWFSSSLKVTVR